jgi:hypothetical protein
MTIKYHEMGLEPIEIIPSHGRSMAMGESHIKLFPKLTVILKLSNWTITDMPCILQR